MITLNGTKIEPTIFPDGTSQVWHVENINIEEPNKVEWRFEHEAELFHLMQLQELLKKESLMDTILHIPYLPYARQDKEVSNETTFSLSTFARIINIGEFGTIYVNDAHSSEAFKLIHYCYNIEPNFEFTKNYDLACFPDAGALKRYGSKVQEHNKCVFYAEKVRDPGTGWITSYKLISDYQSVYPFEIELLCLDKSVDKSVIVVDDLCDGGATFLILGKTLRELGAARLDLYVTHGLFSKGVMDLLKVYDNIITTDSVHSKELRHDIDAWHVHTEEEIVGNLNRVRIRIRINK